MKKLIAFINKLEDTLLVLILSTMIVLAIYQIIARDIFSEGVVWIDPFLRMLVLWVGLAGAVVATRTDNHIRIDILTRHLPKKLQFYTQRFIYLFTLSICLLIAWHAGRFVLSEYEYHTMAFSGMPAWISALIIPVAFFLIALRYLVLLFAPVKLPPVPVPVQDIDEIDKDVQP